MKKLRYILSTEYYSEIKKSKQKTNQQNQQKLLHIVKHYAEQKKPDGKEYTLYNSVYIVVD